MCCGSWLRRPDARRPSYEDEIAGVHRRAVLQRDQLVVVAGPGGVLPRVRGAGLREGGAACRRAEAGEAEAVAHACAVAGEVADGVAIGLARREREGIVATISGEQVVSTLSIQHVVAGV